ncbi:MAG: hypothetical protein HKO02_10905 [Hyphomonadaceae bacterium]|nr:hypothetical protein [Hyphomonadaceae bacterium]
MFAYNLRFVFAPFQFLSTWAHELGHGIGAFLGGGSFDNMQITPGYGGLAFCKWPTNFSYGLSIIVGLIGPSLAGFFVLLFARRLDKSRAVLWVLTAGLILTGLVFSKDLFTRGVVFGLAFPIGVIAYHGNGYIRSLFAQIIGIVFCIQAIAGFDYFFLDASKAVGGTDSHLADTQILAEYIGGPQLFWALNVTLLSLVILYLAARVATKKSPEQPTK